jgi:hypothetical protein
VVVGTFGLFGFSPADAAAGRHAEARVVTAEPCNGSGAMETVRFTVDGRERRASFDGCGHQPEEPVDVLIPATDADVVRAAAAATGEGGNARRFGLLLLVLAGVAGAGYGLLIRRGPRGTPLPPLGPFVPPDLTRLTRRGPPP